MVTQMSHDNHVTNQLCAHERAGPHLSTGSTVVSPEENGELVAAHLTHRYTLVRHHDRSFVAKLLHLRTLHHLHVWVCHRGRKEGVVNRSKFANVGR